MSCEAEEPGRTNLVVSISGLEEDKAYDVKLEGFYRGPRYISSRRLRDPSVLYKDVLILPTTDGHSDKRVHCATEVNHDSKSRNEKGNTTAALTRIPGRGAGSGGEGGYSAGRQGTGTA